MGRAKHPAAARKNCWGDLGRFGRKFRMTDRFEAYTPLAHPNCSTINYVSPRKILSSGFTRGKANGITSAGLDHCKRYILERRSGELAKRVSKS